MPARQPLYVIALMAVLLALSGYLTVVVAAGDDPDALFVYPGTAIEPAEAPRAPVEPVASTPNTELEMTVEFRPRARLLPPADVAGPVVARAVTNGQPIRCDAVDVVAAETAPRGRPASCARSLLRFALGDGIVCRVVEGACDEAPVDVEFGPRTELRGRVLDDTGDPIAGASVWCGRLMADGTPSTVATDEAGEFVAADVHAGVGVPVVVRADGRASQYRVVGLAAHGARPLVFTLFPAGTLRVVFGAQVERADLGVVHVLPGGDTDAVDRYPFFWPALAGATRLDADGTRDLRDLPRNAELEIAIDHPHAPAAPVFAVLRRGEQSRVVPARVAPQLGGRVLGADGRPIPGARVVSSAAQSRGAARRAAALIPAGAHAALRSAFTTGDDGRYRIGRVHEAGRGHSLIEVTAPGHFGLLVEVSDARTDLERHFVLPVATSGDGEPVVRLAMQRTGRVFRLRSAGGAWRIWNDSAPIERQFDSHALVDVIVTIAPGGGVLPIERAFRSVPVVGPVTLDLDV